VFPIDFTRGLGIFCCSGAWGKRKDYNKDWKGQEGLRAIREKKKGFAYLLSCGRGDRRKLSSIPVCSSQKGGNIPTLRQKAGCIWQGADKKLTLKNKGRKRPQDFISFFPRLFITIVRVLDLPNPYNAYYSAELIPRITDAFFFLFFQKSHFEISAIILTILFLKNQLRKEDKKCDTKRHKTSYDGQHLKTYWLPFFLVLTYPFAGTSNGNAIFLHTW
jgi:hypothetical protein